MNNYQLIKDRQFKCPVTVQVPNADGGSDKFTFTATFIARDPEHRREMLQSIGMGDADRGAIIKDIVADWDGLDDEDGQPLEFSDASIDAVARDAFLPSAIFAAYAKALSAEAQRKN